MLRLGASAACLILLSGHIAEAQAQYKCTKDGKVTYSDKPCAEAAGKGASQQQMAPASPPSTGLDPSKPAARPNAGFGKSDGVPGVDFAMFKKALDAGNGAGATLVKGAAKGEDAQTMQRYAETQCRNGSKVACFAAYCGDEQFDRKDYYSRRCADVMGRVYGNTWIEVKAERRRDFQGYEDIRVACLRGEPTSPDFARDTLTVKCLSSTQCRHNMPPIGKDGALSDLFSSLNEAAEAGCKVAEERARRFGRK